jgi:hypothetical protein
VGGPPGFGFLQPMKGQSESMAHRMGVTSSAASGTLVDPTSARYMLLEATRLKDGTFVSLVHGKTGQATRERAFVGFNTPHAPGGAHLHVRESGGGRPPPALPARHPLRPSVPGQRVAWKFRCRCWRGLMTSGCSRHSASTHRCSRCSQAVRSQRGQGSGPGQRGRSGGQRGRRPPPGSARVDGGGAPGPAAWLENSASASIMGRDRRCGGLRAGLQNLKARSVISQGAEHWSGCPLLKREEMSGGGGRTRPGAK